VQLLSCLIEWYFCPKQTRTLKMGIICQGPCICITGISNKCHFNLEISRTLLTKVIHLSIEIKSSARKAREKRCWFLVKINILPVSLCLKGIVTDSLNKRNWEWNALPYIVRLLPGVWYRQKKSIVSRAPQWT